MVPAKRTEQEIEMMELDDITLFAQDWGSLIGLRVAGDHPERFARIVIANGTLPLIPKGLDPMRVPNPVAIDCSKGPFTDLTETITPKTKWQDYFQSWILYALTAPDFQPSQVVEQATLNELSAEEAAAYNAPYPSLIYKAAVRTFPSMIAAVEQNNKAAWDSLGQYDKPFLFLAGELERNLGSPENQERMTSHIPGAEGQPHERLQADHFVQEDIGEILADRVIKLIQANPLQQVPSRESAQGRMSVGPKMP